MGLCSQRLLTGLCFHLQVKYSSLPNFEEREEDFRAESVLLRRRFTEDGARCLFYPGG